MKFELINNVGYYFTFELISEKDNVEIKVFTTKGVEDACAVLRRMFKHIINCGGLSEIEIDINGWEEI